MLTAYDTYVMNWFSVSKLCNLMSAVATSRLNPQKLQITLDLFVADNFWKAHPWICKCACLFGRPSQDSVSNLNGMMIFDSLLAVVYKLIPIGKLMSLQWIHGSEGHVSIPHPNTVQ